MHRRFHNMSVLRALQGRLVKFPALLHFILLASRAQKTDNTTIAVRAGTAINWNMPHKISLPARIVPNSVSIFRRHNTETVRAGPLPRTSIQKW